MGGEDERREKEGEGEVVGGAKKMTDTLKCLPCVSLCAERRANTPFDRGVVM